MCRISIAVATLWLLAVVSPLQAQRDLFVVTSDFSTGSTAFLAAGATEAEVNLLGIHSDAVGRYHDGRVYVINRKGQDNILVLDMADLRSPLTQFSVGNGLNPHDIEIVAPDKAYVTRYDTTALLLVNPQDGTQLGEIDLAAFADSDGLPEVSQIVRVGTRLYLSCQRLDRENLWGPADVSYLIVIDLASDTVVDVDPATEGVQGIVLSAPNPTGLAVVGDKIVVSVVASFGDRAGGVEIVDTSTNQSLGLSVSEVDLGGDITNMVLVGQNRGYGVISGENFANSVRSFDISSGAVGAPLENISGGFIPNLAVDGERLIVADQGSFDNPGSGGLKFYDALSGAFLSGPVDTGLPPTNIVVLGDVSISTAVEDAREETLPQESALDAAYPNPFNASVLIPFAVADRERFVRLTIYDLLGRKVRTLAAGPMAVGQYARRWDGRDNKGNSVGNGTYLVRLQLGGQQELGKVMLLK